ncbi:MAG TPA: DUF559 domain-containing protein [Caulobacteraceae bacterium]
MTPHEARLWIYLRALRAKGFRFRRQVPLKGYYVDFVCFRSRLVIEATVDTTPRTPTPTTTPSATRC